MNALAGIRRSVGQAWESLADGWRDLRERATNAVTRFSPARESGTSERTDGGVEPSPWALIAADVYDSDDRVVVRVEAPGMSKSDFNLEVQDDVLQIEGEKRFERESREGRYRVMQCAYGRFVRTVALAGAG